VNTMLLSSSMIRGLVYSEGSEEQYSGGNVGALSG
jgi:hypothetical protein